MADQADPAEEVVLGLAGVSADGRHLQLSGPDDVRYVVEITPDLRAAVRVAAPLRPERRAEGRLEMKMSSSIRPREIQTRIRAGETAETVAEAAGTSVEAIMPYVAPVLAEREHVAGRAQKASLRRAPGEPASGPSTSRVLGDTVAAHLRGAGADPTTVVWDAYRRDTGRWVLTGTYTSGERNGTARFTFDPPGNYVLADNDDARWLVGDDVTSEPLARDDLQQARARRLAAAGDELPLGSADEPELAAPPAAQATPTAPATPAASATHPATAAPAAVGADVPFDLDEPIRATAEAVGDDATHAGSDADQARHRRPVQKKRGRASVPSWDEIMFGGSDQA